MKQIITILMTLSLIVIVMAFTEERKAATDKTDCYIILAIAPAKKDCNGLTTTYSKGYKYRYFTGSFNYDYETTKIKNEAASDYNSSPGDVYIKSGRQEYAAIVRYEHKISGWDCTVIRYAVGFGNSEDDAEKNALANRDSKSGSYSILENIHCN